MTLTLGLSPVSSWPESSVHCGDARTWCCALLSASHLEAHAVDVSWLYGQVGLCRLSPLSSHCLGETIFHDTNILSLSKPAPSSPGLHCWLQPQPAPTVIPSRIISDIVPIYCRRCALREGLLCVCVFHYGPTDFCLTRWVVIWDSHFILMLRFSQIWPVGICSYQLFFWHAPIILWEFPYFLSQQHFLVSSCTFPASAVEWAISPTSPLVDFRLVEGGIEFRDLSTVFSLLLDIIAVRTFQGKVVLFWELNE